MAVASKSEYQCLNFLANALLSSVAKYVLPEALGPEKRMSFFLLIDSLIKDSYNFKYFIPKYYAILNLLLAATA